MSDAWIAVLVVGAGTMLIKAVGPVGVAHRTLPPRAERLLELVAPAILAALVIDETFGKGRHLVVDARLAGAGAAVLLALARAPYWAIVLAGAAATAAVRAF
ncbi:MAG: AzlD domain-containing protein [Actinomycetota bacterium]